MGLFVYGFQNSFQFLKIEKMLSSHFQFLKQKTKTVKMMFSVLVFSFQISVL